MENHPDIAESLLSVGVAYYIKGEYTTALKYYFDSLKILRGLFN
jgi:hypothetical protein